LIFFPLKFIEIYSLSVVVLYTYAIPVDNWHIYFFSVWFSSQKMSCFLPSLDYIAYGQRYSLLTTASIYSYVIVVSKYTYYFYTELYHWRPSYHYNIWTIIVITWTSPDNRFGVCRARQVRTHNPWKARKPENPPKSHITIKFCLPFQEEAYPSTFSYIITSVYIIYTFIILTNAIWNEKGKSKCVCVEQMRRYFRNFLVII